MISHWPKARLIRRYGLASNWIWIQRDQDSQDVSEGEAGGKYPRADYALFVAVGRRLNVAVASICGADIEVSTA
jgi:hypothetical protein